MSSDPPPGIWMSPDIIIDQQLDLEEAQRLLAFLIKDNVEDETNWDNDGLLPLLFEYYTSVTHQLNIYDEILSGKPKLNEKTSAEEFLVEASKAGMIISLNKIMRISSFDLQYKYRISLTTH